MKISSRAVDLVAFWEGYYSQAYLCPAGRWTIGYGHTAGVSAGDLISEPDARAFLLEDLEAAAAEVLERVKVRLSQNELDALASFVFNLGPVAFAGSTLLRKLNQGDREAAAAEFGRWIYANGRALKGLKLRRAAEAALFSGLT